MLGGLDYYALMDSELKKTKPSDPKKISFAPECFEVVRVETIYTVTLAAPNYPKDFGTDREAAESYARKVKRSVSSHQREVFRRVRRF